MTTNRTAPVEERTLRQRFSFCHAQGRTTSRWSVMMLLLLCCVSVLASDTVPGKHWQKVSSPADLSWSVDKLQQAREFSDTLDTAALMIVQDGIVVDEWGATAMPLRCHSVRKSLLSALFGTPVQNGTIDLDRSLLDLQINDNAPSLTESEREACIRDLLKARSGVYHPALFETASMAANRPQRGSHLANTFWYYNNWDFNTAGAIFEKLTRRGIFEEFENQIAEPLGMEDFRRKRDTRYFKGKDSIHPAYPFQVSTRDLARFGLLFLRDGRWGDKAIVPESWVQESTTSYSDTGTSGGYGYMWWVAAQGKHFPGVSLPDGSYSARGYRGQYLVVIPEWDLVICHRVNSFQNGTSVSKRDFGKLLRLIVAARSDTVRSTSINDHANNHFDVILRGGEVIDGTGRDRFVADVAVQDGRIAKVGDLTNSTANQIVDVTGKIVAPGFIDLHSHAEAGLVSKDPARRSGPNLITQGITTVVVNQDGGGPLDLDQQRKDMRRLGVGLNVVQTLGHGTIRQEVMGDDHQRPASQQEIAEMQQQLRTVLLAGAFGMSAGLEYVPGRWSTAREMESLAKVVAEFDGVYIVHERSSGSRPMWFLPSRDSEEQPSMMDNLYELVQIAANTKATIVATHIKARGTDFWGSSKRMNELIKQARDDGLALFADQYPYNTSGTDGRIVLIPKWAFQNPDHLPSGSRNYTEELQRVLTDRSLTADLHRDVAYEIKRRGGSSSILIVEHQNAELVGLSLAKYASENEITAIEAAIKLQIDGDATRRGGARVRAFSMSEQDVENFAATPWTATSSDARIVLLDDGPVHPRYYGAFPRKIRRYAIDKKLITVEEAVRVSTSLPAEILKLSDRGVIRQGAVADLVVFDVERIRDTADAFQPHQYAEGIDYVFVNGKCSCEGSRWLGNLAGQVLTRTQQTTP